MSKKVTYGKPKEKKISEVMVKTSASEFNSLSLTFLYFSNENIIQLALDVLYVTSKTNRNLKFHQNP